MDIEAIRKRDKEFKAGEFTLQVYRDRAALLEIVDNLQSELQAIRKNHIVTFPRIHGGFDVYDMSPATKEGVLKNKLIELGWTPPNETT